MANSKMAIGTLTIGTLTLSQGSTPAAIQAKELGLSPTLAIVPTGTVSRRRGTAHKDAYYRIVDTDDAVIVRRNLHSSDCCGFFDRIAVDRGYFAARRAYGRACRQAAMKYGLPTEVVLAVRPDLAEEFARLASRVTSVEEAPPRHWRIDEAGVKEISQEGYLLTPALRHELGECGISRRKAAIAVLLPDMSEELASCVSSMGQEHSRRVARYLAELS